MYKVFFDDRELIIKKPGKDKFLEGDLVKYHEKTSLLSDLVHYFEINPKVRRFYILYGKPKDVIEQLEKEFFVVKAAGGVVFKNKKILAIYRREKWDLPKGKCEPGEKIEETAIREVCEECGISGIKLGTLLQVTYHTYRMNDHFVLKKTFWYKMKYNGQETLIPQTEEDIEKVEWVGKKDLEEFYNNTFESIKEVLNKAF